MTPGRPDPTKLETWKTICDDYIKVACVGFSIGCLIGFESQPPKLDLALTPAERKEYRDLVAKEYGVMAKTNCYNMLEEMYNDLVGGAQEAGETGDAATPVEKRADGDGQSDNIEASAGDAASEAQVDTQGA